MAGTGNLYSSLFQIEMLEYWGYPGETITVQTEDGYLLSLDHIPAKENNSPVVFLAHGLLMSSTTWTFGPPEKSLGMVLHDAGKDFRNKILQDCPTPC